MASYVYLILGIVLIAGLPKSYCSSSATYETTELTTAPDTTAPPITVETTIEGIGTPTSQETAVSNPAGAAVTGSSETAVTGTSDDSTSTPAPTPAPVTTDVVTTATEEPTTGLPDGHIYCYECDSRNQTDPPPNDIANCLLDFGMMEFSHKEGLLIECPTGVCSKIDYMKRNRGTGHVRNFTHVIVRGCATEEDKEKMPDPNQEVRRETRDNFCYRHYQYPSAEQRFKVTQCLCETDYCNGNYGNTLAANLRMVVMAATLVMLFRLTSWLGSSKSES